MRINDFGAAIVIFMLIGGHFTAKHYSSEYKEAVTAFKGKVNAYIDPLRTPKYNIDDNPEFNPEN